MVKGFTYTLDALLQIGSLTDFHVQKTVKKMGINAGMEWRKSIQRSLTQHNKSIDLNIQMQIVHVTQTIERYCRPYIWQKFYIMIRQKYPQISRQKCKNMANDKTEKTIRKYSY